MPCILLGQTMPSTRTSGWCPGALPLLPRRGRIGCQDQKVLVIARKAGAFSALCVSCKGRGSEPSRDEPLSWCALPRAPALCPTKVRESRAQAPPGSCQGLVLGARAQGFWLVWGGSERDDSGSGGVCVCVLNYPPTPSPGALEEGGCFLKGSGMVPAGSLLWCRWWPGL